MTPALEITKIKNGYRFSGVLDERISVKDFQRAIDLSATPLEFDFNSVSRASSSGILEWMRFIKQYSGSFFYTNVPVWLVNQFNAMSDLFKPGESVVVSFWAPYFCEADESNQYVLLRIPQDVPLDGTFRPVPLQQGGKEFVPDFIVDRYLKFVHVNAEGFRKFLSQYPQISGAS